MSSGSVFLPMATVESLVHEWLSDVEGWVGDFSALDWVLVGIFLVALYWVWAAVSAATRLGPIEIEVLEHDGKEDAAPPVKALTAVLREQLDKGGLLPPPDTPASSPQTDLVTAITAAEVPQGKWLAQVIGMLPFPKPLSYGVSGVCWGRFQAIRRRGALELASGYAPQRQVRRSWTLQAAPTTPKLCAAPRPGSSSTSQTRR